MLRNSRRLGAARAIGSSSSSSRMRTQRRNPFFSVTRKTPQKSSFRQFSTISGASYLTFQDPWLRWKHSQQQHLVLPAKTNHGENDDDNNNNSLQWIVVSPVVSSTSNRLWDILDRIAKWLKTMWNKLSRVSFLVIRTGEVVIRLSPLLLLAPAAFVSDTVYGVAWGYAIRAIQGLGPVAVKFCQWAATRRDIFHPSLCDELSVLHDKGCPHSLHWTRKVLTKAFGADYSQKGLVIGDVIGCGASAQVYKGSLTTTTTTSSDSAESTTTTREVAIKVLHPNFEESVNRDLDFIEIVAGYAHSLPITYLRMLNLPRAVDEFSILLREQVDLTIEANNLKRFGTNFPQNNNDNSSSSSSEQPSIVFPQPIDGWIAPHAILEDYIPNAVPIAAFLRDSSKEGMDRREELAAPLLRAFLKMVFVDNFIHGDLHPGNVLIKTTVVPETPSTWDVLSSMFGGGNNNSNSNNNSNRDPSKSETKTRIHRSIVFLDAGIVVSLGPNDKSNLFDLFRAVVFNDGNTAGRLMVERNARNDYIQSPLEKAKFAEGIEGIVSEFHTRRKEGLTLGAVRIGVLLTRVLDLCRIYGVEIDPKMANVVISTLVLEGLGRSLSPDLDLLTFARPFLLSPRSGNF